MDIASLHEKFYQTPDLHIEYEQSSLMAADMFTKGYINAIAWTSVSELINVYGAKFRAQIKVKYGEPV